MTEHTTACETGSETPSVKTDLFVHPRRRYLCYCLYLYATPMKLLDIAEQLAIWETDNGQDLQHRTRHEIYRSLQRDHLPTLRDAGFIAYQSPDDMVTIGPADEQFERLVERQLPTDFGNLLRAEAETFTSEQ